MILNPESSPLLPFGPLIAAAAAVVAALSGRLRELFGPLAPARTRLRPHRQRPVIQFLVLVVAQSVFLSWLYNGSAAGLPLVIISHATVDTAARFVLPPFAASSPQLVWWSLAGLWVVTAVVVAVRGRWSGAAVRDVRGDDRATARRADDVQGSA